MLATVPTAFHLAALSGRGRVAHDDNLSTGDPWLLAALQPPQAGLSSMRSERYLLNPAVANVNPDVLVVNALAAADAAPRRDGIVQRARSLHGHRQPVTDIELKIPAVPSLWYLGGWGFAGPSGRARHSWPEHGGSSTLSLLAAPASEAPLAPHLSPSPKKTAIPRAGLHYSQPKACHVLLTSPASKYETSAGSDNDGNSSKSTLAPRSLGDEQDDGTTAERTSRPLVRTEMIDRLN